MLRNYFLYKHTPHIFFASTIAFLFLNTLENLIHFSIGRNVKNKDHMQNIKFEMPTLFDFMKIIIVMVIFAILQGVCTYYFLSVL